jgi:hypothetical protein
LYVDEREEREECDVVSPGRELEEASANRGNGLRAASQAISETGA